MQFETSNASRQGHSTLVRAFVVALSVLAAAAPRARAHDLVGHQGITYEILPPASQFEGQPTLQLAVIDEATGTPTAARFTVHIDGAPYEPPALGQHGLHFTSIHAGRKLRYPVTYARGTGTVEIPLPKDASRGQVFVTKGYEYFPVEVEFSVQEGRADAKAMLRRWTNMRDEGWFPADEHLHYDRLDRAFDGDWLTMLAADGLAHGHFMVARGGGAEGAWATQFAYGKKGEAADGERWIRPGEEYRDAFQGHINLLGVEAVIEPISTGGIGDGPEENYPPLGQVLTRARELGGIGGPAHGATLGKSTTGILDAVLGEVDFFEIANTHMYKLDNWYALLNCGIVVPPVAGTDLPNYPYRDTWQPFLGETRTHVKLGERRDFEAWKQSLLAGDVFVSSGPVIQLVVSSAGMDSVGGVLRLKDPGYVEIEATLSSASPLEHLEIICNGTPIAADVERERGEDGVHRWRIEHRLEVRTSCWIAARGQGTAKQALLENVDIAQNAVAHTSAVQVVVGSTPLGTPAAIEALMVHLGEQKQYYAAEGTFQSAEQRGACLQRFDDGVAALQRKLSALNASNNNR